MPIDNKTLLRVRSIVGAGGGGGEGGEAVIRSLSVTENGTYTAPSGVDGYSPVTVNVAGSGGGDSEDFLLAMEGTGNPTLPSGLTSIRDYAFYNCTNLALTSLPSGVTSIGSNAFYKCRNLALTSLPSGLTSIEGSAFTSCTNLALTSLPSGVTSVGTYVFNGCTNLALTTLPSGLMSIGDGAFQNCSNLAITSLPSGVTGIGSSAFNGCNGLTEITFEGTPKYTVNVQAFKGCPNLLTINVPWAEGEVANAPWGATNATINYNYTGE